MVENEGTNEEHQDGVEGKETVLDKEARLNPAAVELQIDVKEIVKTKQESNIIRKRVIEALVEEEIANRADLLTKALAKRKAQNSELSKIKPDLCSFNVDGSPANYHWSKAKLGERDKALKALNKIDKAINAAINNADYEGVKKIAQG